MILIIDNYDSFTYNLYQIVGQIDETLVTRNDHLSLSEIERLNPEAIIISPGPGNPRIQSDFGICREVIRGLGEKIPILGVCLGHQGIFNAFGGDIIKTEPVHGKISEIYHEGSVIFNGLTNPFKAVRYHSLLCDETSKPECMDVIARTSEGFIMGIKHHSKPIIGLQFHPESIGTLNGIKLIENFIGLMAE